MSYIEESLLGTHAKIFNGKTPSKSEQREVGFPVLKIRDIDEAGDFRGQFNSFVEASLAEKFAEKKVAAGDTLILNAAHNADYVGSKSFYAKAGEIGSLATGEWLIVRPNATVLNPLYLRYWLTSDVVKKALRELVKGIHLYPKDVARLKLKLPPLDEQKRIAAILDQADSLRRLRQRSLDRLNTLSQAIFYEMFGDVKNPRGTVEWLPLSKALDKITDGEHQNPAFVENGMPMVMASQVLENEVDIAASKNVSFADGIKFRKKCAPSRGDILLVGRGATIGRATSVETDQEFCLMGSVILLKLNQNLVSTEYLIAYIKNPIIRKELYSTSSSSAQQAIYLSHLKNLKIPIPPISEQLAFAKRIKNLKEWALSLQSSVEIYDSLFASLQHRAFRGEL